VTKSIQLGMAWCGVIFVAVFFPGLVIAGFFPPIPPGHTAQEVAHQYQQHTDAIRSGCVLMMFAVGFSLPFAAVVSTQLARIEGRWTPLCYTQLAAGAVGMVAATFPLFFFMAASYRPERNPEITQAINDMGWIPFIINWPPFVCQAGAVAVAVLADRRPDPIFPRWIGYFLIWDCLAVTGSTLLLFFKHGVFAWNGLFPFWLAATFFGGFFLVLTWGTIRAVNRQFAPPSAEAHSILQTA
jgi:hypothetical protein